jgi:hypothetical protein
MESVGFYPISVYEAFCGASPVEKGEEKKNGLPFKDSPRFYREMPYEWAD